MNISQLELENFKNFRHLRTEFKPGVNLFVGLNGSGKTSLLEGLCVAAGAFFGSQGKPLQRIIEFDEIKITKGKREPYANVNAKNLFSNDENELYDWWVVTRLRDFERTGNDPYSTEKAQKISDYGKMFFDAFENPDDKTIAPLIVYFSTQRLFKEQKQILGTPDNFGQAQIQKYDAAMGRRNGYLQCLEERNIKSIIMEWLGNAVTRRATFQIKNIENRDFVLENVERVIHDVLIDFLNLPVDFSLKIYQEPDFNFDLFLQYDDKHQLPLSYYSDGFRNLLFLVMDMVWRASQLNPWLDLQNISEKVTGIVMIDEVDLHLHPQWQAKAIPFLQKMFPRVQFFITTHSPTVVANFSGGTLYVVNSNIAEPFSDSVVMVSEKYFGKEVNDVLKNILGASDRHKLTQDRLDCLLKLIDSDAPESEYLNLLNELTDLLGRNDPDIQRALSLIDWNKYKKDHFDAVHQ